MSENAMITKDPIAEALRHIVHNREISESNLTAYRQEAREFHQEMRGRGGWAFQPAKTFWPAWKKRLRTHPIRLVLTSFLIPVFRAITFAGKARMLRQIRTTRNKIHMYRHAEAALQRGEVGPAVEILGASLPRRGGLWQTLSLFVSGSLDGFMDEARRDHLREKMEELRNSLIRYGLESKSQTMTDPSAA